MAAAVSTSVSYLILASGTFWIAQRALRIPYEYRRLAAVAGGCLVAVVLGLGIAPLLAEPGALIVKVLVLSGACLIMLNSPMLTSSERTALSGLPVLRLLSRGR
jgi:hypothetical protein